MNKCSKVCYTILRIAFAITILLAFQSFAASESTVSGNYGFDRSIVGTWDWSFSNNPNSAVRPYGTVEFRSDHTLHWSGGSDGTWEGPYPLGVLLRWDKGDIDMFELSSDQGSLTGKNVKGWVVEGRKYGSRASLFGDWAWSFGPGGNVRSDGKVTLNTDMTMQWSTDKGKGSWEGPIKDAVMIRWTSGPSNGSVDMLALKDGGNTLSGKNKDGIKVRGEKQ